ncbi:MAG: flagellin lysine-N-methylase [Lachnospiraceae bacterium]|nr:flagellin lysine-N-methylase [Lachnospiraceae bacterium]
MEIRQISYFNEFICKGCECPETCCRGWLIPLEKEDLERYSKEKGLMKARLMLAMSEHSIPVFNSSCGECTFHERSGLCSLQVKRGHDFIPETCRNYPRFYRNYGLFEERYLDLSCIEAANMLISHVKDLSLVLAMGEPDCDKTITNDDEPFLNRLLRIRSDMQSALAGVTDFDDLCSVLGAIDSYAMRLQDAYLHGDEDYPDKHPFTYVRSDAGGFDAPEVRDVDRIFPLKAGEITALTDTSIYHIRLRKKNPGLYKLFSLYFNKYRRDLASENGWTRAYTDFGVRHRELIPFFAAYYSYYLYQYWLRIWEDYSFVRHARLGIIHLSMLLLLCIVYEKEHQSVTSAELAHIIAVYNRRAFFSDELLDSMYRVLDGRSANPFTG